jgi:hypothetical protein
MYLHGVVTHNSSIGKYQPFKAEARLRNIYEFSPHREENTAPHRYKDRPVNGCLRK